MQLLLVSDIHTDLDACRSVVERAGAHDLVLVAGDLANQHDGLAETVGALSAVAPTPMVFVAGNNETHEALSAAVRERCPHARVLHAEQATLDDPPGLRVGALGGGVPPIGKDWSFDLTEEEAAGVLGGFSGPLDVLLLHSPPLGVADLDGAGNRAGSGAIRDAIGRLRPTLAVCGHIHPSWGTVANLGGVTTVVNPGPSGVTFELER